MSDVSNVLVAVCGVGTVCCGSFLLALLLLFRVTGRALLIPMATALMKVFFDRESSPRNGDIEDEYLTNRRAARRDLRAKIQSADQQFDQSLRAQGLGDTPPPNTATGFTAQSAPRPPAAGIQGRLSQIKGGGLAGGVPPSNPGNPTTSGEPALPPSTRGLGDYNPPSLRKRRRDNYDPDEEEVYGGALDGDLDGLPDIFE